MNRPFHVDLKHSCNRSWMSTSTVNCLFLKKIFTSYKLLIWTIQDSEEGKGCGALNFGYLVKTDKKLLLLFLAYTLSVIISRTLVFPNHVIWKILRVLVFVSHLIWKTLRVFIFGNFCIWAVSWVLLWSSNMKLKNVVLVKFQYAIFCLWEQELILCWYRWAW